MGSRGPVGKRSDAIMGHRSKAELAEKKKAQLEIDEGPAEIPAADEKWHPIARRWYDSLTRSAQSHFYEPSDWATAHLVAESISRDLKPQFVGISETTGEVIHETIPMKGANLNAYLKAFTALLVTEGDRRRASLEIKRQDAHNQLLPNGVASIEEQRRKMLGG